MGLLDGKTALIFGVANDHSIAWGIAQALHAEGAEVGFSSVESLSRAGPAAGRVDRLDLRGAVRRLERRRDPRVYRALGRDARLARHPGPRARLRAREDLEGASSTRRARGSRSRWTSRRTRSSRSPEARSPPPARVVGADAHLLRGREGRRELQRDGCREGRPRGVRPVPRRGPRARRGPRERDQRGPGPDTRGRRHRGLQADVRRVRRHRAAAGRTSRPRTSAGPPSISRPTSRAP